MNSFEMPMGQLLHLRAKQFAGLEALVGPRRRLTYQEYDELSNQIAHFLLSLGVQKGDRIAVVSETNLLFPLLFYGALKMGAVIVPINWRWTQEILANVIRDVEPKIVFYDESFAGFVYSLHLSPEIRTIQTLISMILNRYLQETYPRFRIHIHKRMYSLTIWQRLSIHLEVRENQKGLFSLIGTCIIPD